MIDPHSNAEFWYLVFSLQAVKQTVVVTWDALMLMCRQCDGMILYKRPGGRLNKKDGLTRYGDSHVKDKTS